MKTSVRIVAFIAFASSILLFQNCSNQNFGAQDLSSVTSLGSKAGSDSFGSGSSVVDTTRTGTSTNNAANLRVYDSSFGDGSKLTQLTQRIEGGGAGLRGCTGIIANYNTVCTKDSDFILITSAAAWGANAYNAGSDVYSVDRDIAALGWPQTTYFTRYILADGSRTEVTFAPAMKFSNKLPRLQWVRTKSQACVGPTPAPAPEGQPCSVEGDSRSNACGTAVCQFSMNY